MIWHSSLGSGSFQRSRHLKLLIDKQEVQLAGNLNLKIYGTLNCSSGKRMLVENRIFFKSETEALLQGYRPCGTCMREAYKLWKKSLCND